jgi:hypothetical protein
MPWPPQHMQVVLAVLADLGPGGVLEDRAQASSTSAIGSCVGAPG